MGGKSKKEVVGGGGSESPFDWYKLDGEWYAADKGQEFQSLCGHALVGADGPYDDHPSVNGTRINQECLFAIGRLAASGNYPV